MGEFFKKIRYCISKKIKLYLFIILILLSLTLSFFAIYLKKPQPENKIYSLIEGTVDGKKTYFLLSIDSTVSVEVKEPVIILDSSFCCDNVKEKDSSKVSLSGLGMNYKKEFKDIKPLIKEIKESTGYEIAGVIGNDTKPVDTLNL